MKIDKKLLLIGLMILAILPASGRGSVNFTPSFDKKQATMKEALFKDTFKEVGSGGSTGTLRDGSFDPNDPNGGGSGIGEKPNPVGGPSVALLGLVFAYGFYLRTKKRRCEKPLIQ
ncbi:MAG: hypothetical protein LBN18_04770 [Dysgonamonadaceae bacterium]|jgi:hypothetical protein|nr:hypothetical protein [Dysgonamonadaceae bacterium]